MVDLGGGWGSGQPLRGHTAQRLAVERATVSAQPMLAYPAPAAGRWPPNLRLPTADRHPPIGQIFSRRPNHRASGPNDMKPEKPVVGHAQSESTTLEEGTQTSLVLRLKVVPLGSVFVSRRKDDQS